MVELKAVLEKLDHIQSDIDAIKEQLEDRELTRDDRQALADAQADLRIGKTTRLV